MQYGMYINENRCMGCFACVVACKDWHDVPAGPASWMRVKTIEKGKYPDLFVAFLPVTCNHCLHPACVAVCPVEAISKRPEDGIVTVDREACLGKDQCGLCLQACPYDAPQFGEEADARMQKCDWCLDRLTEGKKPICVISCPMQVIDIGPLDELRAQYGDVRETESFTYSEELAPSVLFKPKRDERNLAIGKIEVTPRVGTEG
ncbi:MAG: 4Fe-4S dicluster domain-containing protein [Deltaproteobacteria bacterium]|nr:4Fe-4S dicluster domain-containing protein [Deltaproteobacteria bacterium]